MTLTAYANDYQDDAVLVNNILCNFPTSMAYKCRKHYRGVTPPISRGSELSGENTLLFSQETIKAINYFADFFYSVLQSTSSTWISAPWSAIQGGRLKMIITGIDQIIIEKFSKVEKVESIYFCKKDSLSKFYVFIKTDKYDEALMQELFKAEIEVEDEFSDYKFRIHYVPVMIDKANVVSNDYECFFAR